LRDEKVGSETWSEVLKGKICAKSEIRLRLVVRRAFIMRLRTWLLFGVLISIAAVVLGIVSLWLFLQSDTTVVYPAFHWHITGTVLDASTNRLSNVTVTASGLVRVTALNKMIGTSPERFKIARPTDKRGEFDLRFQGMSVVMICERNGYVTKRLIFDHSFGNLDSTNQVLTIHLDSKSE